MATVPGGIPKVRGSSTSSISRRIDSSERRNTFKRSARATIPIRRPLLSVTGRWRTEDWCMSRAASATAWSAVTDATALVIASAAVRAVARGSSPPFFNSSLRRRSDSVRMPSNRPSPSTTGKAPTRWIRTISAQSLKVVSGRTETTSRVITAPTFQLISFLPPFALSRHQEDLAVGEMDHLVADAADHGPGNPGQPAAAHDDQVCAGLLGCLDDGRCPAADRNLHAAAGHDLLAQSSDQVVDPAPAVLGVDDEGALCQERPLD